LKNEKEVQGEEKTRRTCIPCPLHIERSPGSVVAAVVAAAVAAAADKQSAAE